jgi:hypothetical protein
MSARESLREKAVRLLADGRVTVVWVDHERIEAHVRGTDAEHVVTYQRGGWRCSCDAARFNQRCSHLAATQLVCRRPTREPAAEPGLTAAQFRREQAEATATRNGTTSTTRRTA